MIWIVSGPSSAGKSHFLDSPRAAELTGLARATRVWFPKQIGPGSPPAGEDAFVHYNILRPFQRTGRPRDVVVADRETLVARVKERADVEADDPHAYRPQKWLRIYEAIDLGAVYREWRAELARHGITYVKVDGGGRS